MLYDLKQRFEKFSDIEHMKRIKEFLIPKMENFANKIDEWTDNNRQVKECIYQFDQTICKKVNKCDLTVYKQDIQKEFIN